MDPVIVPGDSNLIYDKALYVQMQNRKKPKQKVIKIVKENEKKNNKKTKQKTNKNKKKDDKT